jgi:WD40 repeat protein
MIDQQELEGNQEFETKVRTAFPIQDPDQLFIDRLQKILADRSKDIEHQMEHKDILPRRSPWLDKIKLILSPVAWGAVAIILILALVWGVKNLIPKSAPGGNIKSTPTVVPTTMAIEPTVMPIQEEGTKPQGYQPTGLGMPVPWPEEVITSANASRVIELARWGRGTINDTLWSPDGKSIAVASSTGIYLYDAASLVESKQIAAGIDSYAITFSPDGKVLAAGTPDFKIKLWDVASGSEIRELDGHANFITRLKFSPNGDILASMAYEQPIKLWDVSTGQEMHSMDIGSGARSFDFSSNGSILAITGSGVEIVLCDVSSGTELRRLWRQSNGGAEDGAASVTFSPDGKYLATGYDLGLITLWDTNSWEELRTFTASANSIYLLAFSPDGAFLASNSYDEPIKLWDVNSDLVRLTLGEKLTMGNKPFSLEGKIIGFNGSTGDTITIWDSAKGNELGTIKWESGSGISAAVSPDGNTLAVGSYSGNISLLDIKNGRTIRTLGRHTDEVDSLAYSPDGSILASGSYRSTKLWDVASGNELSSMVGQQMGWGGGYPCVTFSPDGGILAFGALGGQVLLWDMVNNVQLKALGGEPGGEFADGVTSVAFSPDGKTIVSGYDSGNIIVWDVDKGEKLQTLTGHVISATNNPVSGLVFSLDGTSLISAARNQHIKFWDTANWSELRTLSWTGENDGFTLDLSPLGDVLAAGGWVNPGVSLIAASDEVFRTLDTPAKDLLFTPDGKLLITASMDGTIHLWGIVPSGVNQPLPTSAPSNMITTPELEVPVQATPEELEIKKVPIPAVLTSENIERGEWSLDSAYLYYSQQGPMGGPGPDQATVTISFLDARTGSTCEGIQEIVKMVASGWGTYPERLPLYERARWMSDNRLLYLSPNGELLAITPCSPNTENWTSSIPDTIISLLYASKKDGSQFVLKGQQAFWLLTPSTSQNTKLGLPLPEKGAEAYFDWSLDGAKLFSCRIESRQGDLWLVFESIDTVTGAPTPVFETQASAQLQNVNPKLAWFDWVNDHEILISDKESYMDLVDIANQPVKFTDSFTNLFGIKAPSIESITAWGVMDGLEGQESHLILATGGVAGGQYYIYHLESGKMEQYPLDPPLLVIYPSGEGGISQSLVDSPSQKSTFRVILVDSGTQPFDLVVKGHETIQNFWNFATPLTGTQQVMFTSRQGISLVDIASGEIKSFWSFEGQEQYQDFYSSLSPDGKSVVALASANNYQTHAMYWLRLEP